MNTPTITSTSLYFREGNSDKEYHLAVEPSGEGYIVTFSYGRRGKRMEMRAGWHVTRVHPHP